MKDKLKVLDHPRSVGKPVYDRPEMGKQTLELPSLGRFLFKKYGQALSDVAKSGKRLGDTQAKASWVDIESLLDVAPNI